MGRTACTEPQYLYKGAFYLFLRKEAKKNTLCAEHQELLNPRTSAIQHVDARLISSVLNKQVGEVAALSRRPTKLGLLLTVPRSPVTSRAQTNGATHGAVAGKDTACGPVQLSDKYVLTNVTFS